MPPMEGLLFSGVCVGLSLWAAASSESLSIRVRKGLTRCFLNGGSSLKGLCSGTGFCGAVPLLLPVLCADPSLTKTRCAHLPPAGRPCQREASGWVGDQALQGVELRATPRPPPCHPQVRTRTRCLFPRTLNTAGHPERWRSGFGRSFAIWVPFSCVFQLISLDCTSTVWLSSHEAFLCVSLPRAAISSSGGSGTGSEKFYKNQPVQHVF